ncbi:biotin--[acetyl-CoA-carboxylase] ligase [Granulicoccus sp. GXG6511]|uniref:biotin--[acetyl-CoA-carboxylase] ligase n=1 Tax=Granulicoccus sp. GXG6511 TaxID=3381351 RepID=UPI003D7CA3D7
MPATPPPDAAALTADLVGAGSPWTSVTVLAATGSTNEDLSAAARRGAADGTILMTDNQTAGRGRLDRAWTTPPGVSVATSVLLRPVGVPVERWPWLSLMTGLGLVDGLRVATGLPVGLKWPNDVLVADRKLCGLLAERVETPTGPAVILGFGINVSMDRDELPVDTATSLRLEGAQVDKTALMSEVLRALAAAYSLWREAPDQLAVRYAERCVTIGRHVRVQLTDAEITGTAVGIDPAGGLRVETPEGVRTFSAGDVVHLRRVPDQIKDR